MGFREPFSVPTVGKVVPREPQTAPQACRLPAQHARTRGPGSPTARGPSFHVHRFLPVAAVCGESWGPRVGGQATQDAGR